MGDSGAPGQSAGRWDRIVERDLADGFQRQGMLHGSTRCVIHLRMVKAHLFLPLETVSSNDKITADFVKDHVYLSDPNTCQLVTLSGLRGQIEG